MNREKKASEVGKAWKVIQVSGVIDSQVEILTRATGEKKPWATPVWGREKRDGGGVYLKLEDSAFKQLGYKLYK